MYYDTYPNNPSNHSHHSHLSSPSSTDKFATAASNLSIVNNLPPITRPAPQPRNSSLGGSMSMHGSVFGSIRDNLSMSGHGNLESAASGKRGAGMFGFGRSNSGISASQHGMGSLHGNTTQSSHNEVGTTVSVSCPTAISVLYSTDTILLSNKHISHTHITASPWFACDMNTDQGRRGCAGLHLRLGVSSRPRHAGRARVHAHRSRGGAPGGGIV